MRSNRIEQLLNQNIAPLEKIEIFDESHKHAGRDGQESHFKILIVSDFFEGQNRVQRQRKVNELLKEEFNLGLHALSMRLLTCEEYNKQKSEFKSPDCQGQSS